ncbi:MAG: cobalt-precorrin-5B (C(1))-methyltransferase, partial [Pseudomonadales bacterium]|nr:cobalt-precorrin-5B (C(1))-methyltransferase [Pseudomonadales bacterium]
TACALASATVLFSDHFPEKISVTLPKEKVVELAVSVNKINANSAIAYTIKDAGDDPDVTHGAKVFTELQLNVTKGVVFFAGKGVGTVTREGLLLAVGEPAINPVPRAMMVENLQRLADKYHYEGGFSVTIGVENGEAIAQKTMNPRLGILGGLSILGTTGIVRPYSCAAWIASIYQGIDVAKANGVKHLAASTGNSSEHAVKERYQLSDMALIEMGDFVGAVFKQLKKNPIDKLTICGGFGKITKLAAGHKDLNSRVSSIDFTHMAEVAESLGANTSLQEKILTANTSIEVLNQCNDANIDLATAMCERALATARASLPESILLEVLAINRKGQFVGSASEFNNGDV